MSDEQLLPRDARRLFSRAIIALLQGVEPADPSLARLPPRRELQEQADAGEGSARFTLRVLDHWQLLPKRSERALARERVEVIVADGSHMSLEDAERILMMKEERGPHRQLRASIDEALAPFRQFDVH